MALPALGQEAETEEAGVEMTDYGTVTLAVQDTDLAQVLEMLSIQSQKNIITSKSVSATISANLYDVTFYEALDSILRVNGYDYLEDGNFIYIYTQDEMQAMQDAMRKTESRIFVLDYLSANDANELIAPLLSEGGRSSFRGDVDAGIQADAADAGQDDWAFEAMLVVNDYPDNLENIATLLADLDVPPQQVLIEATVLQTKLDEANAFGIDFSVVGNVNFNDFTNPLSGVDDLLSGADNGFQPDDNKALVGSSTVGNTPGAGGFKLGIVKDDLSVFLKVLDEVTDNTILARPKIMCLNRQRAEVLVGKRFGYLSTTATETTTTQTVEFLDTGIHLMFRPFISRDGMIRLELAPSVSDAFPRTVTDAQNLQVTIPDEVTNEITTNVRIQDGQTLVLGGLFRESTNITRRQVPFLGDIPLIGAAFQGQDDTVVREEIIFLITPSIVRDEILWAAGEEVLGYSDAVQLGARKGLLPFSREKQTDSYNHRARDAFRRGDLDRAIYFVNNSLRLNQQQPEIVRFREKLTGAKESPTALGIMERTFRTELGDIERVGGNFADPDVVETVGFVDPNGGVTPAGSEMASEETPVASSEDAWTEDGWDDQSWDDDDEWTDETSSTDEEWNDWTDETAEPARTSHVEPSSDDLSFDTTTDETETVEVAAEFESNEFSDDEFTNEEFETTAFASDDDVDSTVAEADLDSGNDWSWDDDSDESWQDTADDTTFESDAVADSTTTTTNERSDFERSQPERPAFDGDDAVLEELLEAAAAETGALHEPFQPIEMTDDSSPFDRSFESDRAVASSTDDDAFFTDPSFNDSPSTDAATAAEADRVRFVQRFIDEYFGSLGLADVVSWAKFDEFDAPFTTFEDMIIETDVAGAENEGSYRD
jgi:type IV pilus assembly protein PilQ